MKNLFLLFATLIFVSCRKEALPSQTDLSYTLLWKASLTNEKDICGSIAPIVFKDKVVFHRMFVGPSKVLQCKNKSDGSAIWDWDDPADIYDGEKISHLATKGNDLFVNSWNEVYKLDALQGKTVWKSDANLVNLYGHPRFALLGDRLLHQRHPGDDHETSLLSYNPESGEFDKIFQMFSAVNNGYVSSFESFAAYPKNNGDTLLLFQNRQINFQTFKDRIDLYALNLRTLEVEWKRDSIDQEGNSSVQSMLVVGDKVYFMGVITLFCIDARNGQTIWEKRFNKSYPVGQLNETLLFTTLVIVDGKLIVKPTDKHMYAIDPENGNEIWKLDNAATSPESMSVYKDLVLFPSSGKDGIFAHRVSDGKLMGRLLSPNVSDSKYSGAQIVTGIAVDEKEGLLFCTDGYFGMCFKIDY